MLYMSSIEVCHELFYGKGGGTQACFFLLWEKKIL
jgi:hypothetical protein